VQLTTVVVIIALVHDNVVDLSEVRSCGPVYSSDEVVLEGVDESFLYHLR
jgi:hypothetical protein